MKRFILRISLFGIILILPILLFVIIDPFMIIGENRGEIKMTNEYSINTNRDFQSIELFLKQYDKENYDSFILGNSRSLFFNVNIWKKYIDGNCFHLNSNSESLFGIERKLKFLNERNVSIKNVLVIIDYSTLKTINNSDGHLFIKHPLVSGESTASFYKEMFRGFFPKPTFAYLDLFVTGTRKNYMEGFGIRKNLWKIDYTTNQLTYFRFDSILNKNQDLYYKDKKKLFYTRDSIIPYSNIAIGNQQKELLKSIKSMFKSHNTNYKIVVSPLYNQIKLNMSDLEYLNNLFGESNVFDFSGKNNITDDYTNYYETSHYRPFIADDIMKEIYGYHESISH